MKTDALTIAVVIFVVGILASGLGLADVFEADDTKPPAALHQGVAVR